MEHSFADRYSSIDAPVQRLDARAKSLIALFFILMVVATPPQHVMAFTIYAGLLLWGIALARVPVAFIAARAAMVLPFSALTAIGLPFFHGHETVAIAGLNLSVAGLWIIAGVTMKSTLSAAALALLVATTRFSSLLAGLRSLKAPAVFIDLLGLTYRFIFLLTGEGMRLKRAALARGYDPKWLPQATIVGRLAGSLFVRSYERAERVYGAMLLRGYDSDMPAAAPARFRAADAVALAASVLTLASVRIFVK